MFRNPIKSVIGCQCKYQSYPMQDEPEGEVGFQYKMSLKGVASWRIDNQRARSREIKPGSDPGFSTSQPNHPIPGRKSTRLNSSHLGISYAVFSLKNK